MFFPFGRFAVVPLVRGSDKLLSVYGIRIDLLKTPHKNDPFAPRRVATARFAVRHTHKINIPAIFLRIVDFMSPFAHKNLRFTHFSRAKVPDCWLFVSDPFRGHFCLNLDFLCTRSRSCFRPLLIVCGQHALPLDCPRVAKWLFDLLTHLSRSRLILGQPHCCVGFLISKGACCLSDCGHCVARSLRHCDFVPPTWRSCQVGVCHCCPPCWGLFVVRPCWSILVAVSMLGRNW